MLRKFAATALLGLISFGLTSAAVADRSAKPCPTGDVAGDESGPELERDSLRNGIHVQCESVPRASLGTRLAGVWYGKPKISTATTSGPFVILDGEEGGLVVAREGGTVSEILRRADGLYEVFITRHGTDLSLYSGLSAMTVTVGQSLTAGDPLGSGGVRLPDGRKTAWYSRKLPAILFGSGTQSPDVNQSVPDLTISLDGWVGDLVEIWIDGIYVGELNPIHEFRMNLTGLRRGHHEILVVASGQRSATSAILSFANADQTIRHPWTGKPVQRFSASL